MIKHAPVAAIVAVLAAASTFATFASAQNTTSPRIRYDNQCFIIDGKDTFLYSGSFHYFRCPKALWADRFQKMKDAGMNCVETYVAWNWHEQQMPSSPDDYSKVDMTDLTDWLNMAINQFGFYVILRPGPYICAEWDGGGYPQWLVTKRPATAPEHWYRSDDPAYLQWCRHWYTEVAKVVVPFQITHTPAGKPGVILWQIENEYNYAQFPAEVKLHQLQALAHDSRDLGIDVPLITCMTSESPLYRQDPYLLANVIECRNTYPGYSPDNELRDINVLKTYQPEKPRMITELQGGWFSENGNRLSGDQGFTAQQITHVTLLAWANGYTGSNYYMMFGGTNLWDWGSANKTTSYDYAAPIREWGGVGPRYFAVQSMANFLKDHGAQLARSQDVDISGTNAPDGISGQLRKGRDGSLFLFVFNDQQNSPASGSFPVANTITGNVQYDLTPYDAKILYLPPGVTDASKGQWYPQPVTPPARPTNLPAPVTIADVRTQVDPGPIDGSWRDLPAGDSIEDVGVFNRGYVFFKSAPFTLSTASPAMISADLSWQDDFIGSLNDNRLDTKHHGRGTVGAFLTNLSTSSNQLELLYENGGRDNGGGIDARCGLKNLAVSSGGLLPMDLPDWIRKPETGDASADVAADVDDSTWASTNIDNRPNQVRPQQTSVFRTHFDLTAADIAAGPRQLVFGALSGQRHLYVNGSIILGKAGPPRYDLTNLLHPGRNTIAVIVIANTRSAGIGGSAELDPVNSPAALPIQWQISTQTTGLANNWQASDLDDSNWNDVKLDSHAVVDPPANTPINLVWYRLKFPLPAADPHVWVPWKLHIEADGNGFIYLNGHQLGRWWEIGPQKDFFLPECWLNFGPTAQNVVAICMRPTTNAAAIKAASVSPYADFAESR
jgi:hypothetical protein